MNTKSPHMEMTQINAHAKIGILYEGSRGVLYEWVIWLDLRKQISSQLNAQGKSSRITLYTFRHLGLSSPSENLKGI